jgi:hypothetical protein
MTDKTDADFLRRVEHFHGQMSRFIEVHRRQAPPAQAEMLIELKIPEQWLKSMGDDYAAVCSPPTLAQIEKRMQAADHS